MAMTYTVGSWAVIFGLAGLMFYFNYYKPSQAQQAALSRGVAKGIEKKKEPKKSRKIRKDDVQGIAVHNEQQPKSESTLLANEVDHDEEELNNKEFARQLSSTKAGTLMPSKSQDGGRQRSIKQTRAQEKPVETGSDNGTTGADADDDRSPVNSPELGARATLAYDGDVSDMLESRTPGPSVLRLTSPSMPATTKKTKAAGPPEVSETKKQRQNRQKTELRKQMREEEEKERKILLEKQRRTAREAEGRAAKDGSAFMAAKAPTLSAWTGPTETNGNANKTTDIARVDFLDTYTPKASTSHETSQSESELAGSDWQKVAESISEEEQVRRAMEDSDSWKTVSKDKRKKKIQPAQSTQPTQPTKPESEDDVSDYAPPRLVAPSKPGQKWGMTLVTKVADDHYEEYHRDVQDSEWEVA
ncbi:hypothetical protein D0Z07_3923 [Hyphodiscus hymeniophilus]|uniref:Uncharacterized protein n=1 Tax=Hyphodiscus hymeniophilus TaxID=353542 RepID=A0A9P6VK97_9HELO|nr:hypothetical protein D0Z07_3923 [Hyphodiscus hymeniophilus]